MNPIEAINVGVMVVLVVATIVGLVKGLVRQVVELIGLIASYMLAMVFAGWLAEMLRLHTPIPYSPSLVAAFVALFLAGIVASHFIAVGVQKVVRMSFMGWFDRLCGGALGLVVGVILSSLLVTVALELPLSANIRGYIRSSEMCVFVRPIAPQIFNAIFSHGSSGIAYDSIFRRGGPI